MANRTLALHLPGGMQLFVTTGGTLWTQQRSSGVRYERRRILQPWLSCYGAGPSSWFLLQQQKTTEMAAVTTETPKHQSSNQTTTTNLSTLGFSKPRCRSCHPTNSVKAMKANNDLLIQILITQTITIFSLLSTKINIQPQSHCFWGRY